jgi:hypothetical protein
MAAPTTMAKSTAMARYFMASSSQWSQGIMAPPRQGDTVFRSVRARFAPLARCAWFFAGVFFLTQASGLRPVSTFQHRVMGGILDK